MKVKWKKIPGYAGLYEASSDGRIRTLARAWYSGIEHRILRHVEAKEKALKADSSGYLRVTLSKKGKKRRWSVHTLVLMTFVGEPPQGYGCRHLDGDKLNNSVENLKWGTPKECAADRKTFASFYKRKQK